MAIYAADPFVYTDVIVPASSDTRPLDTVAGGIVISRSGGEITIAFSNDAYAYEETGHTGSGGGAINLPVNGAGQVDLYQPAAPISGHLDAPWLTAIRVISTMIDYGEANHPSFASSNQLGFSCFAMESVGGVGWGVSLNYASDSDAAGPSPSGVGWTYSGTTGGPFATPFWLGTMSDGSGVYQSGIWYGSTPPHLNVDPDLVLSSGSMTPTGIGQVNHGKSTIFYTLGGFETGTYGFTWNPLFVQPGGASITIDAFIFEGGEEWDFGPPAPTTTRESWGMLAS